MPLEDLTGNKYVIDLNSNWPLGSDLPDAGDDHLRGIKNVLLKSFPNIDAPVLLTPDEINNLLPDLTQAQEDIDGKVAKAGDTMTGPLTLDQINITDEGPSMSSTFATTGRRDILFKTGTDGQYNTLRIGEGGGLNCKWINLRPDPGGDAPGMYIGTDYFTSGVYNIVMATGNGVNLPYKKFNFGQAGNANFPGDLYCAGRITAGGGIGLATTGVINYAVHVGEQVALPQGQFTYISLVEEAGKPVLRFGHAPFEGASMP